MRFSSKDFSQIKANPQPNKILASRLICRRRKNKVSTPFSKERGHRVRIIDLPTHTLSVTIGYLKKGQSTHRHRHNYETVLYVVRGKGVSSIGDQRVSWQKGDAIYVPAMAWHSHSNEGNVEVEYVACENAPLLQNLGGIAVREEFKENL